MLLADRSLGIIVEAIIYRDDTGQEIHDLRYKR